MYNKHDSLTSMHNLHTGWHVVKDQSINGIYIYIFTYNNNSMVEYQSELHKGNIPF